MRRMSMWVVRVMRMMTVRHVAVRHVAVRHMAVHTLTTAAAVAPITVTRTAILFPVNGPCTTLLRVILGQIVSVEAHGAAGVCVGLGCQGGCQAWCSLHEERSLAYS